MKKIFNSLLSNSLLLATIIMFFILCFTLFPIEWWIFDKYPIGERYKLLLSTSISLNFYLIFVPLIKDKLEARRWKKIHNELDKALQKASLDETRKQFMEGNLKCECRSGPIKLMPHETHFITCPRAFESWELEKIANGIYGKRKDK